MDSKHLSKQSLVYGLERVNLEPSDDEKLEIIEARGKDYKDFPAKCQLLYSRVAAN